MSRLLPVIAVLATCSLSSVAVGQEPPPGIECGDTITADTTLDRDLTDCPDNGILIDADDITLDLNGHTISGDGEPVRRCPRNRPCDIGIGMDDHAGVTIRGGSVRGFALGVGVFRGRNNRLVKLDSSRNQYFGFVIGGSSRTVIRDSTGHDNPRPDGDGLGVFMSHDLRIVHNSFRRNGQLGIHIQGSTKNLVKGNLFSGNGDMGIFLEADGNQVRANRSVRDGDRHPRRPRQPQRHRRQPHLERWRWNRHREGPRQRGRAQRGRPHTSLRHPARDRRPADRQHRDARSRKSGHGGRQGRLPGAKNDRNAILRGNTARRSGDDGFDINSTSAQLFGNRALGSADLGIEFP